jgi:hypothetical protein
MKEWMEALGFAGAGRGVVVGSINTNNPLLGY